MPETFKDYYYLIGLDKEASYDDIKNQLRLLFKKFHPDKNDGADEEEVKQFLLRIGSKFTIEDNLTTLELKKTFITKLLNEATDILIKKQGKKREEYDNEYVEHYSNSNDAEPDYDKTVEELKKVIIDLFNNINDSITKKEDYLSDLFVQCYQGKVKEEEYNDLLNQLIKFLDGDINVIEVALEQASIYQLNNILTTEIRHLNSKLEYLKSFKTRISISFTEAKEYVRKEYKKAELKKEFPTLIPSIERLLQAIDNLLIQSYNMNQQKSELNFEHIKKLFCMLDGKLETANSYIADVNYVNDDKDLVNYVNETKKLLAKANIKHRIIASKKIADKICEIVGSLSVIKKLYKANEFLNEIPIFEQLITNLNTIDIDSLYGQAYDDFRDYLVNAFNSLEIKLNTSNDSKLEYTGRKYQTIYIEDWKNNTYTTIPIKDIIKKLLEALSTIGYEYEKEINKNDEMDMIREQVNKGYETEKIFLEKFLVTLFNTGSRAQRYNDHTMSEAGKTLSVDLDSVEFERYINKRLTNIPNAHLLQYFKFIDLGYMFEGAMNFDRAMELLKMMNTEGHGYKRIDDSILAKMYDSIKAIRIFINEYITTKLFPRVAREANVRNADMQELLTQYAINPQLEALLLAASTDFSEYMKKLNSSQLSGKMDFVSSDMKRIGN